VNRFRGFLVPRQDWIKVLYLFGTLGLRRLLTKTLKFLKILKFQYFQKFQNSKIIFFFFFLSSKFQNFHKILKFQQIS
jgi:hypothetical protein